MMNTGESKYTCELVSGDIIQKKIASTGFFNGKNGGKNPLINDVGTVLFKDLLDSLPPPPLHYLVHAK